MMEKSIDIPGVKTVLPIKQLASVKPHPRQIAWQQLGFYGFIHFGVNTFTDEEWGSGKESPEIFNPVQLDADQWVRAMKAAGMSGLILTCKHHDGFCLWPSKYTEHSVKNSRWKNGAGDVVREVSRACSREGLKFGVYLSPWDMHEKKYGETQAYNDHFVNQLEELLTNYGEVFCVWFDGACGVGENGQRQQYDWERYYQVIRRLQPNAVISVCGPDVRWCGNEAGHCRSSEWSVVPALLQDLEKIQDASQKVDDGTFRKKVTSGDEDLGSRKAIAETDDLVWYPAEINTSIRPGWFYHSEEDGSLMDLQEFKNIYMGSVGGNGCFLLNIPPDRRGLLHENDVERLRQFGKLINDWFSENLAEGSFVKASETLDKEHAAENILEQSSGKYWCPGEGIETADIIVTLKQKSTIDTVVLMEHIAVGQRIEEFEIIIENEGNQKTIYSGTTIGYKRICTFTRVPAERVVIRIIQARWQPTLEFVGFYNSAI